MTDSSRSQLRLHVAQGMHQGALVPLDDGEHLIGSATECDVVLMDSGIAPRHAKLRVAGSVITATALEGPVRSNGDYLSDAELSDPLGVGDQLDVGTVSLRLVAAVDSPADGGSPPPTAAPNLLPGVLAARFPALQRLDREIGQRLGVLWSGSAVGGVADSEPSSARYIGSAIMFSAGVAIVLGWSVFLFTSMSAGAADSDSLDRDYSRAVTWLDEHGLDSLEVQREDGVLHVSGLIADGDAYQSLRRFASSLETATRLRVTNADDIAGRAETLLERLGAPALQVTPLDGRRFEVSGFAGSAADLERYLTVLKRDLPAVREVREGRIVTMEQLREDLESALDEAGLASDIALEVTDSASLQAVGIVGDGALQQWRSIAASFESKKPDGVSLTSRVRSSRDVLGLDIRTVSHGPIPYILGADGRRFMEGSDLPGGYVIRSIGEDAVVVAKQGHEFVYEYGN
ncbi:type III secretion protein D [Natronocella acetinitrilica]|uniref:Type III secretion protein D n=1 Tax=Natronocella acetinitrilica TaxID=414046 RepID=A0AAE3G7P5_9GAMM|nr:type III secretion system inner membrane ring subunit SctD [Natronocella acetinitrilica]MCP1675312.1 type III secretion protein D [Natronocella acetinitrilica]